MRALLLLLLAGTVQAETLFEYGRQCAAQISEIPAFNCMAGEEIPITIDGKPVPPQPAPARCDKPSLLPQHDKGSQGQCVPGSRALVLRDDTTAQISAICRKQVARVAGSHLFDEINVISHSLKDGKTCWFTAKAKAPLTEGAGIDGRRVPSPSTLKRPAVPADKVWLTPYQVAFEQPACISCHDSGPFMYSPYIAQTTMLPGDPFGFYQPKAIGADFKRAWAKLNAFGITTRGNTCTACHRMGNMNSCKVAMDQSTGRGHQEGGDEWSKKFPQSHWMSPGNLHSQAQWNEQFADSLKKLAACCENPQGAGCKVVEYGPKAPKR
ncbi:MULTISPECIES: hypothetical protein [unclassified Roseateles]|uniref:hypothetical protein n=1 Tax=unclassified Roseateles TaxID=2626991 RepID=UPI0007020C1F|nr:MULTISPECIES: hypothetical protein [unclassified Roseateles]KQW45389.1 hypothetical protein ASC81_10735 [Pelomonas sp. Root405]KRA72233.1 hypothetical protein ASD88_10735 [Pelomonas sp. Root662]